MGNFDLDYSHLCAVVAPDRIPLHGNEHRITRIAFDMFRLDDDKENLWQVQADDDGNEFLVRTYELPKEDAIQATSEWRVMEDGRRASLTVVYKGMPVHRLVAAEYGAHAPDEVKLLRDLVQTKLAEPEFAGRMLASMPEPKRVALLATFPKLAAGLPKIPQVSGKDPLEGIEPMDPREYSPVVKGDQPLPPPGDWKKHPQMADDEEGKSFCQMINNCWPFISELQQHLFAASGDPALRDSLKYLEQKLKISAQAFQQESRKLSSVCKSDNYSAAGDIFNKLTWMASAFLNSLEYRKHKSASAVKAAIDAIDGKQQEWVATRQKTQKADDPDPWRDRVFQVDMGRPEFREEAKTIASQVMAYLQARPGKKISLQMLYMDLEVNDTPLYMALHALVKGGLVNGQSPYDKLSPEMAALMGQPETSHKDLFYSVGKPVQNANEGVKKTRTLSMTVAPEGIKSFMISFLQNEMTKAFSEADTEEERYGFLDDFCTNFKDFIQKQRSI